MSQPEKMPCGHEARVEDIRSYGGELLAQQCLGCLAVFPLKLCSSCQLTFVNLVAHKTECSGPVSTREK